MVRLKFTTPGMLLILAVLAAGSIFLLDMFYLHPQMERQQQVALKQEAVRVEQGARMAIHAEQQALLRSARTWARTAPDVRQFLALRSGSQKLDSLMTVLMLADGAEYAWLWQDGRIVRAWSHDVSGQEVRVLPGPLPPVEALARVSATGLLPGPDGMLVFASADIPADDGEQVLGRLFLASGLGGRAQERVDIAVDGRVRHLWREITPEGPEIDSQALHRIWTLPDNRLVVAWSARDAAGDDAGHMRAEIDIAQINHRAEVTRRTILIVVSLCGGMAVLIVVGAHMLIAGPVLRLLKRIHQIESGRASSQDLTRDLHGEPRALARRLENAFEKLAHLSNTDQLTNLANRRHFQEVLGFFLEQAHRYNRPVSVITMDLDFFKAINDTGGHSAGDELLCLVADELRKACRKADLPARLGGDEFAMLLPETDSAAAAAVAERIRRSVGEKVIQVRGAEVKLSISAGVADLSSGVHVEDGDDLMSLADRALYRAKELGRNRVVQASELVASAQGTNDRFSVEHLSRTLAGLDQQFKDLFLKAVEEIVLLLERRDIYMADHARKVRRYAVLIARQMGLSDSIVHRLEIAATLHDIGMLSMPDSVLLCPGHLDDKKREQMEQHTILAAGIMRGMQFLEQEVQAVLHHHERWDGEGYPEALGGADIPLPARILAVADSFDAMTSPRTFRGCMSRSDALAELHRCSGRHFDPAVVDAFSLLAERMGDQLLPEGSDAADDATFVPTPTDQMHTT